MNNNILFISPTLTKNYIYDNYQYAHTPVGSNEITSLLLRCNLTYIQFLLQGKCQLKFSPHIHTFLMILHVQCYKDKRIQNKRKFNRKYIKMCFVKHVLVYSIKKTTFSAHFQLSSYEYHCSFLHMSKKKRKKLNQNEHDKTTSVS